MLNSEEINAIGQICDTTVGRGSTTVSPTMSIKTSLQGDTLSINFITVVYLASDRNLRDQVGKVEEESLKLTKDYVSNLKKEFKEMTGRALKLKELNTNDSVEIITAQWSTPRRTAYYRRFTNFHCE